jgi:hypothetical protein
MVKTSAYDLVERRRFQARCPSRPKPCTEQASAEQVGNDRPVHSDSGERHCSGAERQGVCDHNEAHGLVKDDRFQGCETEKADQKRQAELRAAKANQPAERADNCPSAECNG